MLAYNFGSSFWDATSTYNLASGSLSGDLFVGGNSTTTKSAFFHNGIYASSTITLSNQLGTTATGTDEYIEMLHISAPGAAPAGHGRWYVLRDEFGDEFPYFVDDAGTAYDLTGGGGGGCTTLGCLSDATTGSYTDGNVLRANGSIFTEATLGFSDLSGNATETQGGTNQTTYTTGDILYSSAANTLSKLGIGTEGYSLTVSSGIPAWVEMVNLTSAQSISGVKTFNSYPIGPGGIPTSDQELVDKAYADSLASGFLYKEQVVAASVGDVATSGPQTVDGVSAVAGDRVLLKDEPETQNNGCYVVVDPGDWTLCTDSDTDAEVGPGTSYFVGGGTVNDKTGWAVLTADPITPGTTEVTYGQISGATAYTAGDGLDLAGAEFSTDIRANRGLTITSTELDTVLSGSLTVDANGLKVATTTPFSWTGVHDWSALTVFTDLRSALINATSTRTDNSTTTNSLHVNDLFVTGQTGLTQCAQLDSSGRLTGTGSACGSGGGGGGSGAGNATSTFSITFATFPDSSQTWRIGNTAEELEDNQTNDRIYLDLSNVAMYRVYTNVQTAWSAGTDLNLQYSTDEAAWNAVDTGGAGEVVVDSTGVKIGAWTDVVAGAKQGVYLRIVGKDGGNSNGAYSQIGVQFSEKVGNANDWNVNANGYLAPTTTIGVLFPSNATTTGHCEADSTLYVRDSKVGIATTSPITLLSVGSATPVIDVFSSVNNDGIDVSVDVNRGIISTQGNTEGWLLVTDAGATANQRTVGLISDDQKAYIRALNSSLGNRSDMMTFDLGTNVGKVGINQTTPEARFEVDNGANTYATAIFSGNPGAGTSTVEIYTDGATQTDGLGFSTLSLFANSSVSAFNTMYMSAGATTGQNRIMFGDLDDPDIQRIASDNQLNTLEFWTNNTERMTIESGGNVGIGVNDPDQKLEVAGEIEIFDNTTNLTFSSSPLKTNNWQLNGNVSDSVAGSFRILSNSTEIATFSSNGQVDIDNGNLTIPNGTLEVQQTGSTVGITVTGVGTGSAEIDLDRNSAASWESAINFQTAGDQEWQIGLDNDSTADFHIIGDVGTVMTIADADGAIGIGTTDPDGDLELRSSSGSTNFYMTDATDAVKTLLQTSGGSGFLLTTSAHDFRLGAGNAEAIRIDTAGQVGIGTTAPTSTLQVEGGDFHAMANNGRVGLFMDATNANRWAGIGTTTPGLTSVGTNYSGPGLEIAGVSNSKLNITSGNPAIFLTETDQAADNQIVGLLMSSGNLEGSVWSDNLGVDTGFFSLDAGTGSLLLGDNGTAFVTGGDPTLSLEGTVPTILFNDTTASEANFFMGVDADSWGISTGASKATATGVIAVDTVGNLSRGGHFSAYDGTGGLTLSANYQDIGIDTTFFIDTGTYTFAAPTTTVDVAGTYKITADCGTANTLGSARTSSICRIEINNTAVTGTECNMYNRVAGVNGVNGCSITYIDELSANDKITVAAAETGTDTITTDQNATRLTIEYIQQ
jgi:hypothetical protein